MERHGGAGLGYVEYALVIEEDIQGRSCLGLSVAAHNSLCTGHILSYGTE
ncbi:MAG: acyl-CoA dehydrogenase family protein [Acidobacteriota bacterium]